jgi:hypothetical protein
MVDEKRLCSVVVVEDSGGAANAICHAIDDDKMWNYEPNFEQTDAKNRDLGERLLPLNRFPDEKFPKFREVRNLKLLWEIRKAHHHDSDRGAICRFGLEQSEASLSTSLLRAVQMLDHDRHGVRVPLRD